MIPILGEMLVPGTKYNITERSINGYTIVNTLQVHSTFGTLRVETMMVLFWAYLCIAVCILVSPRGEPNILIV